MAIDGQKIIHAVMEGSRYRDAKGIIPLFGVYLSLFSVRYYNKLSFEFEMTVKNTNPYDAKTLLTEAAQECGYATFHGIRNSKEWEELVVPMIEKPEDQLEGFVAVAVAFGWGDLQIAELIPNELLIVRAYESYEATGFIESYGISDSSKCYMLRGVCGAFMDLIYGENYPEGCFTFTTTEEKCRAKGDEFCEFVVKKSPKKIPFF